MECACTCGYVVYLSYLSAASIANNQAQEGMRYGQALDVYFHSRALVRPFVGRGLHNLPASQQFIPTFTCSQPYRSLNMTSSERTSDVSPKLRVGVIGTNVCADDGVQWISAACVIVACQCTCRGRRKHKEATYTFTPEN